MSAELHSLVAKKNIGKVKDLLLSLVPRAQCFCFYDLDRECAWSSDGADDYEIDGFVAELPANLLEHCDAEKRYIRRTLKSGRTLLVLPVCGERDDLLGALIVVFSRNAGKSSSFNPGALQKILAPAVDVIGERLDLDQRLQQALSDSESIDKELQLVYEVDEKLHGTSRSHSGLAQLVGQSGRFLSIAYSVLLMPSKRIRISATHSSWKSVNRKVLDRYLVDHMLPKLEGRRSPKIFEIPRVEGVQGQQESSCQALLCPLIDQYGNIEGLLAQLGRVNKKPFDDSHRRFMSHIVRKVEYVIEQSFDSMTGLMNRSGFEAQLRESWKALESESDSHQLIYMDLDNLQLVNDTFGRKAGDAVIMRFARILEEDLPKSAVLSRLRGDDFCILLTNADSERALGFAKALRDKGQALRYLQGDKSLQVTISIGVADFSLRVGDESTALTAARMACESAKDHGRDRIEVYDDSDQSIIRRHDDMQLVGQIQQALDADSFELQAQSIINLQHPGVRQRYEVLLRMKDHMGKDVPTHAWLSAAERYQMMPQIDRWVVSSTIAKLAENVDAVEAGDAVFSVNLSGQSLSDDDILEFIEDEIGAAGLPAKVMGFEVTESAAVSNLAKAQQLIDALRSQGCTIALDDFGAGLSSFAYLKNFKADTLKIDGGFIRDIADNCISQSMVAAITQVAKVMDLKTVAEYVEDAEAQKLVTELAVDYAQGHAVGRPEPLDVVLKRLDDARREQGKLTSTG